jgi:putative ABC transport system permease protein
MNWSLATRNLLRDRRRSLVTMASVVIGLSAILLFLSYIRFIETAMARLVIFQDGNGHVQVYKAGGPENLSAFPARYALTYDDQWLIARAIEATESTTPSGVVGHSYQLMGVGMLHNGERATGFLARGVQPGADAALRDAGGFVDSNEDRLPDNEAVLLTRQVADLIGLTDQPPASESVQLSGATYSGRFNAIDTKPAGRFTTGIEAIDNAGVKLPLRALQALYDTTDVSRVVIQLKERVDTKTFAQALQIQLDRENVGHYIVTRWDSPQVGQLYLSFMGFANTMFMFTGIVLTLIVVATMQHTIAASVTDRLKEIGVMRSMGFARSSVTSMFVHESLLLGCVGAVLALLTTHALCFSGAIHFETALPRLSVKVPVLLELPSLMSMSVALLVVCAIGITAWYTAHKVLRGTTARPGPFALARLVTTGLAFLAITTLVAPDAQAAKPDTATLTEWLEKSDFSRGSGAGYSWIAQVHSAEATNVTDTTYDVAVRDGRGLVRVLAPAKQAGEKILLDGRAMWYGKKGLRKPVSISPQQRLSGEAANGDIAAVHYARDYTSTYVGEVKVDGKDCYELALSARSNQVTYDAIRYYIDKKTLLGVRADFMTATGVVFKSATFEYANRVRHEEGFIPFVSRMHIVNSTFPDRFSEIRYSEVKSVKHLDNLFRIDELLAP